MKIIVGLGKEAIAILIFLGWFLGRGLGRGLGRWNW